MNRSDTVYVPIRLDKQVVLDDAYSIVGFNRRHKPYVPQNNRACRSALLLKNRGVVSVAPPSSVQMNTFFHTYHPSDPQVFIQEWINGTMINLFWNGTKWEISTRRTVGGSAAVAPDAPSFAEMFEDTCTSIGFSTNVLHTRCMYSFVMQHPAHTIVVPVKEPVLKLVRVFDIDRGVYTHTDGQTYVRLWQLYGGEGASAWLWLCAHEERLSEFSGNVFNKRELFADKPASFMGYQIYHKRTGERTHIINPAYVAAKTNTSVFKETV